MKKIFLIIILVLVTTGLAGAWGFFGHKVINQMAIYALPKPMQAFFYKHQAYLVTQSVRPDVRRNTDKAEAPRHFIDIDVYGTGAVHTMPESWTDAVKKYPADTLRKYGIVPWHVVVMQGRLTRAFRNQDPDSILFYAADLGHYIADAHVPLHATVNYDGQLTNQAGFHSFWESKLPEMFLAEYQLFSGSAQYLANPEKAIWQTVRSSYALAGPMLQLERDVTKNFAADKKYVVQTAANGRTRRSYTDDFARAFHLQARPAVEQRLQLALVQVASFWYTAWVDGGQPDLEKLLATPLSRPEKKALKKERKAWKKNQLLNQGMLLATKAAGGE